MIEFKFAITDQQLRWLVALATGNNQSELHYNELTGEITDMEGDPLAVLHLDSEAQFSFIAQLIRLSKRYGRTQAISEGRKLLAAQRKAEEAINDFFDI